MSVWMTQRQRDGIHRSSCCNGSQAGQPCQAAKLNVGDRIIKVTSERHRALAEVTSPARPFIW